MLDEFMNQILGVPKPKRRKKKAKKHKRIMKRRKFLNYKDRKDLFEAYGNLYNDIN